MACITRRCIRTCFGFSRGFRRGFRRWFRRGFRRGAYGGGGGGRGDEGAVERAQRLHSSVVHLLADHVSAHCQSVKGRVSRQTLPTLVTQVTILPRQVVRHLHATPCLTTSGQTYRGDEGAVDRSICTLASCICARVHSPSAHYRGTSLIRTSTLAHKK